MKHLCGELAIAVAFYHKGWRRSSMGGLSPTLCTYFVRYRNVNPYFFLYIYFIDRRILASSQQESCNTPCASYVYLQGSHVITIHKLGGGTEWWPGWWTGQRAGGTCCHHEWWWHIASAWAAPWQPGVNAWSVCGHIEWWAAIFVFACWWAWEGRLVPLWFI